MDKLLKLILFIIFILASFQGIAQNDYLASSWKKQVKPIECQYLTSGFTEKLSELGHNFYPWQQTNYQSNGQIWGNANEFAKQDTLKDGQQMYNSKTVLSQNEILFLDFGDEKLFPVTKGMFKDQTFKTARYLPTRILDYFERQKIHATNKSGPFAASVANCNEKGL